MQMLRLASKHLIFPRETIKFSRTFCQVNMSEESKVNMTEESKVNLEGTGERLNGEYRPDYPWKGIKKCAAMLSFSGKKYHGMQRNQAGELKTIESEFLYALAKSGQIDPTWENKPQKAFFTRASRTDKVIKLPSILYLFFLTNFIVKGVSAARMVCSLKMLQEKDSIEKVNEHLPPDIRLQAVVRVGKNFNCQKQADARYEMMS